MSYTQETKNLPFLKDVQFVEADGNDWSFSPCRTGVPVDTEPYSVDTYICEEPKPIISCQPIIEDRILFKGEYVCAEDPRLVAYLKGLGLKDMKEWKPYSWMDHWGSRDVQKETLMTFGKILGKKWLESESAEKRLTAMEWVSKLFRKEYPGGFYFEERDLRDKVIGVLRNDRDSEVRAKAAEALGHLYAYWGRSVDETAKDAIFTAFRHERDDSVQKAILRTPFYEGSDLISAISNPSLSTGVREEAVLQLSYHMSDYGNYAREFMPRLAANGEPKELKVAALGALVIQTWAKWPIPEGHYGMYGLNELTRADLVLPYLQRYKLTSNSDLWKEVKVWLSSKGVDRNMDEIAKAIKI